MVRLAFPRMLLLWISDDPSDLCVTNPCLCGSFASVVRKRLAQFEDRVRKAVNSLAGFPNGAVANPIDSGVPSFIQNLMNCRERGQSGVALNFGDSFPNVRHLLASADR
jgi:hypothetical protein